jgi:cytochrome subunit of sulfide dehydrogenase
MYRTTSCLWLGLWLATAYPSLTQASDIRTLAASCSACHGQNGISNGGTPSLAGLNTTYFSQQMQQFKSGKTPATVMHHHARGLNDTEIEALASYFAGMPKNSPSKLPTQAFKGAQ